MLPVLLAAALAAPVPLRGEAPLPPPAEPLDRVVAVALRPADAPEAEGSAEVEAVATGNLCLWVLAPGPDELVLRVEDAEGVELAAQRAEEGAAASGPLPVARGQVLRVRLTARAAEPPRRVELHVAAAPESDATRAAAARGEEARERVRALLDDGEPEAAAALADATIAELCAVEGAADSLAVTGVVAGLGMEGYRAGSLASARRGWEPALALRGRCLPPTDPRVASLLTSLRVILYDLGDLAALRRLDERSVARLEALLPAGGRALAQARARLGDTALEQGLPEEAVAVLARAVGEYEAVLPPDEPELLAARQKLGIALRRAGEPERARAEFERVLEARERSLGPDHPRTLLACTNLAVALADLGDHAGERALLERVVEARERRLPEDDPELVDALERLAGALGDLGELAEERAVRERVLAALERVLPDGDLALADARDRLATVLQETGRARAALELARRVVAAREAALPPEHPDVLAARSHLAIVLRDLGELRRAHALFTQVAEAALRIHAPDHPQQLAALANLAVTADQLGDAQEARALQERVLAGYERTLRPDHPNLLLAQENLAGQMRATGDLVGARVLAERVLEARRRALPAEHYAVLDAEQKLATTLRMSGEPERALALLEEVLDARERALPADHPDVLVTLHQLALAAERSGDRERARELQERVLAARERALPAHHPSVLDARNNLAGTLAGLGELERARALQEDVLAARERALGGEAGDLLRARRNLLATLGRLGDLDAVRAQLGPLVAGSRRALEELFVRSPRELREAAGAASAPLDYVLWAAELVGADPALGREVFELVETRRLAAAGGASVATAIAAEPALRERARAAAEARRLLDAAVARAVAGDGDPELLRADVADLAARRDREEHVLRAALHRHGALAPRIEAGALARALGPGAAFVGFARYERWRLDESTRAWRDAVPSLFAHVLRADGSLARVELGPADELERLALAWRAALGHPLAARGVAPAASDPAAGRDPSAAGAALRERLLAPVLAAAGDATRLHVCLDDFLAVLPLDALPDGEGRVGDRLQLVHESGCARLLAPPPPAAGPPRLLAMGDARFGAEPERDREREDAFAAPLAVLGTRGAPAPVFAPLPATRAEARAIGALFERAFDAAPRLSTGRAATKDAFLTEAPGARFLHVATHGWFAPESVPSELDEADDAGAARLDRRELVTGLAPMTLCGLAFAGADAGRDALGRAPGILTGEELAGLDLRDCELAVLSACETNVGLRRAGQGVQSLQTALHVAGARTAVTSLWKVGDEATRELMEGFYRYLWEDGLSKVDALWRAKSDLRAAGRPERDWAGWVLTGDPD